MNLQNDIVQHTNDLKISIGLHAKEIVGISRDLKELRRITRNLERTQKDLKDIRAKRSFKDGGRTASIDIDRYGTNALLNSVIAQNGQVLEKLYEDLANLSTRRATAFNNALSTISNFAPLVSLQTSRKWVFESIQLYNLK